MAIPRVFWSVTPQQTQSPYIRDIAGAIEALGCRVESLTLRAIAQSSQEIVHIQWPEHVSRGPSTPATFAKHGRAVALLAALRLRKHAIVLTAHNRAPHGESDPFDAWFRRTVQKHAAAMVLLVPGHHATLEQDNAIGDNTIVRTIAHPTHPPANPLTLRPDSERTQLVVLGQIHPYHRIEEFIDALTAQNNTRPVLIIGGVGDEALLARLRQKAHALSWLTVQPGFADDATLEPILENSAAIVSLQRNTFNSGGPFYALPRGLPIIMSSGAQASNIDELAGDDWVFAVPDDVGSLDLASLNTWLDRKRTKPVLEPFAIDRIAAAHIELYELLQS